MGKKKYKFLADFIALSHFSVVGWAIWGTIFQFFSNWYDKIHLPILALVSFPTIFRLTCPLTTLERKLRKKHNPETNYQYFWRYHFKARFPRYLTFSVAVILITVSLLYRII